MATRALTPHRNGAAAVLIPKEATGNQRSRLEEFCRFLSHSGQSWHTPDLIAYQHYLVSRDEMRVVGRKAGKPIHRRYGPVGPSSIASYLATVRGRYAALLKEPATRERLYNLAADELARLGQEDDPANRYALVSELQTRLQMATTPSDQDIKPPTVQDRTDADYGIRLTRDQANALLDAPGLIPIDRLRDTAILALFLCTGIREAELCALDVTDLRQTRNGELCLLIRLGKGSKRRIVFYGANEWVLAYLDKWTAAAGITEGPVFRGFYKPQLDGTRRMRPGRLTVRAVQGIVGSYPVMRGGELVRVHPHDLRRTYARTWYELGGDLVGLQQNLGHSDPKTTLHYVGILDASLRQPPSMYTPPHWAELEDLEIQGRIA